MWSLASNDVFRIYALTAAVLALHLLALAALTGTVRVAKKQWVNEEDAKLTKGEVVTVEDPRLVRVKRAHQNALENAVPFFIVGLLYALTGPTRTAALVYFGTFAGARILHSIVYVWGRQPFRTIAFTVGALATLGMGVHVIRHSV